MRTQATLANLGLLTAALGLAVCLALGLATCGPAEVPGTSSAGPQGEETTVNHDLPALDTSAPGEFQTATFAYG